MKDMFELSQEIIQKNNEIDIINSIPGIPPSPIPGINSFTEKETIQISERATQSSIFGLSDKQWNNIGLVVVVAIVVYYGYRVYRDWEEEEEMEKSKQL